MVDQFRIVTDPVGNSVGLSAIFAVLPLLALFVLLGVLRMRAWLAGVISLVVALVVAITVYSMPVGQSVLSATEGAAFGFFPILWIVLNAIWVYNLTVVSGHFDVLRRSMARVSPDMRVQAVIVAFCFGALLEALAGFGTPVAVTVVMLIALGFNPVRAASVALIANTAPVAFGALATPIVTLGTVAAGAGDDPRLNSDTLGAMVGRQTPILAVVVPLVLVLVIDGVRGLRQTWPVALAAGLVFGLAQFAASNYLSVPLTDIVAALLSAAAVIGFLRIWKPAREPSMVSAGAAGAAGSSAAPVGASSLAASPLTASPLTAPPLTASPHGEAAGSSSVPEERSAESPAEGNPAEGDPAEDDAGQTAPGGENPRPAPAGGTLRASTPEQRDSTAEIVRAYAPYLIIIAIFSIISIGSIKSALAKSPWTVSFHWPGLHVLGANGKPLSSVTFAFGWLPAAGTMMIVAGILTAIVLRISPGKALRAYGLTYADLRHAIATVMAVLALAYVMNQSGQTNTLGEALAATGGVFVLLSPILGWIGTAVTGSDTSANALFGALQVQTAAKAGLDPVLLAAANSSGGVLGKMISPQNLAIAASAVGMAGREGDIFRRVVLWSVILLLLMCLIVGLQGTGVLSWMIPS
jgi:lactate permease